MSEILEQLITSGASGAFGAFLLIKFCGKKWIDNRFKKDLERFKAQKLYEFDLLLTRKTKWHEKEHEVLSEAWKKLIKAHNSLKFAIREFKSFPDLNKYSDKMLKRFMKVNNFTEDEQNFMKERNEGYVFAFSKIMSYRDLNEADKALSEFHIYFDENRIFLRQHIKEKFSKVGDYIGSSGVSQKMNLSDPNAIQDFGLRALEKEEKIKPLIKDIENIVQKELFPEG